MELTEQNGKVREADVVVGGGRWSSWQLEETVKTEAVLREQKELER